MAFQDFFNQYNGQKNVGNTPENKGQCVGLVEVWIDTLGEPHVWGDAKDLYANAPLNSFVQIPNTPTAIPQQGDIIVWSGSFNGGAGHTGIATGKGDINSFECFEQNDPIGSACHLKTYSYAYIVGWLRPKNLSEPMATITQKELDQIRNDRDNNWNLYQADEVKIKELQQQLDTCTTSLQERIKAVSSTNTENQPEVKIAVDVPQVPSVTESLNRSIEQAKPSLKTQILALINSIVAYIKSLKIGK